MYIKGFVIYDKRVSFYIHHAVGFLICYLGILIEFNYHFVACVLLFNQGWSFMYDLRLVCSIFENGTLITPTQIVLLWGSAYLFAACGFITTG